MATRIPKKYRDSGHIYPGDIERIEEDMEAGAEFTFRMVKGTVKVVEKGWEDQRDSHEYHYRGFEISIDIDDCYNPWKISGQRYGKYDTLDRVKAEIDKRVEK